MLTRRVYEAARKRLAPERITKLSCIEVDAKRVAIIDEADYVSMNKKILPEPDHFATCPEDGNILGYYGDVFESVFVLLHPFIRPVSIPKEIFKPDTYPDTFAIAKGCEAVRWSEIMVLTGLSSLAAVDIGLRTRIGGLKKTLANQGFADAIDALYERYGIVSPDEGSFSDLLHSTVLHCFQSKGYQWVWVGDEFGTERRLYWVHDLKSTEAGATGGHCNVFSTDKSLLWTTHWDSHFSFLCGSREVLESFVQSMHFEGFFCDKETEVYWSVQSPE